MEDEQQQQYEFEYPEFTSDQLQDKCKIVQGLSIASTCFWWTGLVAGWSAFWFLLVIGAIGSGLWTLKQFFDASGVDIVSVASKLAQRNSEKGVKDGDGTTDNL